MKAHIRSTFLTGVAVVFPLVLTILVMKWLVGWLNSWVLNPLIDVLRPFLESKYAVVVAKFGVFIIMILVIIVIGWAAKIIVVRQFFSLWERALLKIPFLGKLYEAFKQFGSAIFGSGRAIFKRVVIIEYPRKGVYSIAFVTGETKDGARNITPEGLVNVLVATTPSPASGYVVLVKKEDIIETDITVEEGVKMVISGGFVGQGKFHGDHSN